jgi:hypothetical protein
MRRTGRIAHRVGRVAQLAPLLALACGFEFPAPYEAERTAYAEFVDYGLLEGDLSSLRDHLTGLDLAIGPDDIGTGSLESLLISARREGVPVRAWLLVDDADGYWPGEDNLDAFREQVDAFSSWNRDAQLGVETIVVDMEPPLEQSTMLAEAVEAGRLQDVVPVLLANRDPAAHEAARAAWSEAVDEWHDRGLQVALVTLPYLLDDFGDDDTQLQDMFECPIQGIAWDELAFMVYQNLWTAQDGGRLGPPLVHSYALTARERFGDDAAIALGTIGSTGKNTSSVGYAEPEALGADAAAVHAAGIDDLRLFSVDGMRDEAGLPRWLGQLPVEPLAPAPSEEVDDARALVRVLDTL